MAHLSNKNKALSNLSLNLKTDNQTGLFFCIDHLLQISKLNSRNTADVAHSKKTTHNSPDTRKNNQQIKFLNNWTEQNCLLPVTHREINLPLPLDCPECTYTNDFYREF